MRSHGVAALCLGTALFTSCIGKDEASAGKAAPTTTGTGSAVPPAEANGSGSPATAATPPAAGAGDVADDVKVVPPEVVSGSYLIPVGKLTAAFLDRVVTNLPQPAKDAYADRPAAADGRRIPRDTHELKSIETYGTYLTDTLLLARGGLTDGDKALIPALAGVPAFDFSGVLRDWKLVKAERRTAEFDGMPLAGQ